MQKLALVVLASLSLSGCTTLGAVLTNSNVNKACVQALKGARTAEDIAVILERHGVRQNDARKLADGAAKGEIVIARVCVIADALSLGR